MFTHSDLQCAGLVLACKHRTCCITGKPLYNAEFIQWAKDVLAYFARSAWDFARKLNKSLKAAWAYIFVSAKELDAIQAARRKAKQLDKAKAMQAAQARQPFSFRSNVPPVVATYGQTGRQLEKGRLPKERFAEIPTMKTKISRHYVK